MIKELDLNYTGIVPPVNVIILLLKGKNDPLPKKTVNIEQVAFGICKICLTSPTNKKSNYPLIYHKLKMITSLEQFQEQGQLQSTGFDLIVT